MEDTTIELLRKRKGLMNVKETAELLSIHKHSLYRWVLNGKIQAIKIGWNLKFDPKELANWLERRQTR